MTTVLDYLDNANTVFPERIAYADENRELTFCEVAQQAAQIGAMLSAHTKPCRPVAVISQRSVLVPVMYLGIVSSGCFYVPININQPLPRIKTMLTLIKPDIILTDGECSDIISAISFTGIVLTIANGNDESADAASFAELQKRRDIILDTNPIYTLFTSGSTGVPKGIVLPHRAVRDYLETFIKTFLLSGDDILASQADFGFDVSLGDIYIPLITGAKTVITTPDMFSAPQRLFAYLNKHHVTTLCWVTTALEVCCNFNAFECGSLETVKRVFFAGSALPAKHLRTWQKNLPDTLFINHYGPTEITVTCTYHIFDHIVEENEDIPIGIPFPNREVFLLDSNDHAVPVGEQGEICVKGSCLAHGYYRNLDKTAEVFTENPLEPLFFERIYRTGDLGIFRDDGVLLYRGRKDRQIKHMGYRIELGEIEAAALRCNGVNTCACIYNNDISLFYEGTASRKELAIYLRGTIPGFMIPRHIKKIDSFPMLSSGKINYNKLLKDEVGG